LTSIDIIYKLNLALFVLLLYICIFFVLLFFFDGNKENKQTHLLFIYNIIFTFIQALSHYKFARSVDSYHVCLYI